MTTPHHYPNAPITEAIIDVRVTLPEGSPVAVCRLEGKLPIDEYPIAEEMFQARGVLEVIGSHGSAAVDQTPVGFKLTAADGKRIVQSRIDGFGVSQLHPYGRWEDFRDEAKKIWAVYREAMDPVLVSRLAVRYINRIDIPTQGADSSLRIDLEEYFRTVPAVSPDLPHELTGFFMQLRLNQENIGGYVLINQTIVPPPREQLLSVALDIDLIRESDVPSDEDKIWEFFEALHIRKNAIFEACITDKTRRLFR